MDERTEVHAICTGVVMKRYHQNLTDEVKTFRTWALMIDSVGEDDFKWLHGFGIPVRVEKPEHTFDTVGGRTHTVYGKPTFTIDTTTDKQRDMVVLKYGNLAVLIQEEHILPGSTSVCTLDRIVW